MAEPHVTIYDEDLDEEVPIPARWELCDRCGGRKYLPFPGIAFTADDMAEAGPEFYDDYMNGTYDEACPECKGEGMIAVPNERLCTPEQLKAYEDRERAEADYRAVRDMEIRYGC